MLKQDWDLHSQQKHSSNRQCHWKSLQIPLGFPLIRWRPCQSYTWEGSGFLGVDIEKTCEQQRQNSFNVNNANSTDNHWYLNHTFGSQPTKQKTTLVTRLRGTWCVQSKFPRKILHKHIRYSVVFHDCQTRYNIQSLKKTLVFNFMSRIQLNHFTWILFSILFWKISQTSMDSIPFRYLENSFGGTIHDGVPPFVKETFLPFGDPKSHPVRDRPWRSLGES